MGVGGELWTAAGETAFSVEPHSLAGGPFVALEKAVDAFVQRPEALHTAAEIGDQVVSLVRCASKLKLEAARLMGVFSDTNEAEAQAFNDEIDFLRVRARASVSEALSLRAVGRQLGRLPVSAEALKDGEIGFSHLLLMAHNAAFSEKSPTAQFDEAPLLEKAKVESVSRFRRTCLSLRHAQDPQGVVDEELAAVEFRNLTANETDDGRHFINVELDGLGYLQVIKAIDSRSHRFGPDDHRDKGRRRADALVNMCNEDMARSARPGDSLSPNHLVVYASLDTFLNRPGSPAAESEYGVMLSGAAVGRFACADVAITQVALDGKLLPVGVSKMKRRLSKREMRALRLRYPRCVRPGCRRPASECEAHHITWYSRGGKTVIEDMCMLCPLHHWQVHEGGWQMARNEETGDFVFVPPQLSRGPTEKISA
ncbi:MAG: DUF222 domain-containing protein [Candidatus Dormibacteria bacterium]